LLVALLLAASKSPNTKTARPKARRFRNLSSASEEAAARALLRT
jgi:hypothetical protein